VRFQHVGCVAKDAAEYTTLYRSMGFPEHGALESTVADGLRICNVEIAPDFYLEVIEPIAPGSGADHISKRGGGYYHLGFRVDDLEEGAARLERAKFVRVSTYRGRNPYAFFVGPQGHAVELLQLTDIGASSFVVGSSELRFRHIGCIVPSIDRFVESAGAALGIGGPSRSFHVRAQGARVCFAELGPLASLEIAEADGPSSWTAAAGKKHGRYYHLGFGAPNLEKETARLVTLGFSIVTGAYSSEALDGRRCVFLANPLGHLVQLVEETVGPTELQA
jgi:catechol 2,3-dioxygenase-like lactoylglutathione lyase family enzyme